MSRLRCSLCRKNDVDQNRFGPTVYLFCRACRFLWWEQAVENEETA